VDVPQQMLLLSADVLGKIAFGFSMGAIDAKRPEDAPLYSAFQSILNGLTYRSRDLLSFKLLFPTKENKIYKQKLKEMDQIVEDILQQYYKNPKHNDNCLLARLTESDENGTKLSKQEILENMKTFLFAGHDTTGSTLAWAVYYLALHQDVQQIVRQEVLSLLGKTDNPSYENLREGLPYTNAVIKEVLRLQPSVIFTRKVMKDTVLDGDRGNELPLKAGNCLLIAPYYIHRNPLYWGKNAEEFIPERWLKAEEHEGRFYIPFSLGHRGCIGMKLALLELTCSCVLLVKNWKMLLTPSTRNNPPDVAFEITLHPTDFTIEFVSL